MNTFVKVTPQKACDVMASILQEKAETLTDEVHDELWSIFNTEFDHDRYQKSLATLYTRWRETDRAFDPIAPLPPFSAEWGQDEAFIRYLNRTDWLRRLFLDCLPYDVAYYLQD